MEIVRDLSFDYAERTQSDKCGELEYNKTPAIPCREAPSQRQARLKKSQKST